MVDYNRPTYYTNYNLNDEGQQHHILFYNKYSHYIILGFEDTLNGDNDFDDVFISISDNNEGIEMKALKQLLMIYLK